jgi:DNA-binding transcriptional regulator YhcF (GntR family)
MKDLIQVNKLSNQPKYQQIVTSVIEAIEKGRLKKGEQLPSISELAEWQETAKVTVAKAYEQLRQQGVIRSQHGKGFYVASNRAKNQLNIFLLFDTLNSYKEVLYNSLKSSLPRDAQFSIFFHHYNKTLFTSLIQNNLGNFNYYIIMPHFDEDLSDIVDAVPRDKLLLIDKDIPKLSGAYAAVYQDFENDVFNALGQALDALKKYARLNLVLGKDHFQYVPKDIIKGFKKFAKQHNLDHALVDNLSDEIVRKGEAYLLFSDSDMVQFIKYCRSKKLQPGKDIGFISYDDTPLKEILLNGITVITTDFEQMGRTAGKMIVQKQPEKIANPGGLILRKTL